jgi:hypothetical protein
MIMILINQWIQCMIKMLTTVIRKDVTQGVTMVARFQHFLPGVQHKQYDLF